MTKKEELKWRLREAPTSEDVIDLLDKGIIDKDEARSILFSVENKDDKIKSLEEQVKFLQDLVKTLSRERRDVTIHYPRYVETKPWWNNTHTVLCSNSGAVGGGLVMKASNSNLLSASFSDGNTTLTTTN